MACSLPPELLVSGLLCVLCLSYVLVMSNKARSISVVHAISRHGCHRCVAAQAALAAAQASERTLLHGGLSRVCTLEGRRAEVVRSTIQGFLRTYRSAAATVAQSISLGCTQRAGLAWRKRVMSAWVRITFAASCAVCGGTALLKAGGWMQLRQLDGRCAPAEHQL